MGKYFTCPEKNLKLYCLAVRFHGRFHEFLLQSQTRFKKTINEPIGVGQFDLILLLLNNFKRLIINKQQIYSRHVTT